MSKELKCVYIFSFSVIALLIGSFIYTCIIFNNYNKCREIDFNSKSCERLRNY